MDVDQVTLHRLLDLQAEDTAIKRLSDRKAGLPEAVRLSEVTGQLAELDADLEIARKQRDEIGREQARLEGEMGLLDTKIQREEGRLFSGGVSNPKELGALQAEVAMLKRKRAQLEDSLLEVMVQKDQATETVERLETEQVAAGNEKAQLSAQVEALTQEIDGQSMQHSSTRAEIAGTIPDQLLTLYETVREQKHGVGVAALAGTTCEGCHTTLPSVEVERLRKAGGVQRCDNCRRILVIG